MITAEVTGATPPGPLELGTAYAWRIDAVNSTGTTTGEIWNFQTRSSIPPPVDTITISRAEWSAKRQELKVEATSSAQPGAVLTLESPGNSFGTMTFRNNKYIYKKKPVPDPGSITVNSNFGGIANTVTVPVR